MASIFESIEILSKEKGIDPQIVINAVKDAMLVAARKQFFVRGLAGVLHGRRSFLPHEIPGPPHVKQQPRGEHDRRRGFCARTQMAMT